MLNLSEKESERRLYFKEKAEREGHHNGPDMAEIEKQIAVLSPFCSDIANTIIDSGMIEVSTGGNIRSVHQLPNVDGVILTFRLAETCQGYINYNLDRKKENHEKLLKEYEEDWLFLLEKFSDEIDVKVFFQSLSGRWSPLFYNLAIKKKGGTFTRFQSRLS